MKQNIDILGWRVKKVRVEETIFSLFLFFLTKHSLFYFFFRRVMHSFWPAIRPPVTKAPLGIQLEFLNQRSTCIFLSLPFLSHSLYLSLSLSFSKREKIFLRREDISDRESNSWMYFFLFFFFLHRLFSTFFCFYQPPIPPPPHTHFPFSNWKCRCPNGNAVLKMHAVEKFNSLEKKIKK